MEVAKTLDAKGLACPMPIVRTKKAIEEVNSGDVLEVVATDAGAKSDLTAWTKSSGHELLETKEEDGVYTFYVQKG
ncbi:TusA-related sulfurtransferase [Alkalibacillus filiformis]|uniref:TusA-related sulfurtransferase n=1 Tax=Alkalibacillus filiformis TaxID=200990 RepID=A0ABU0DWA5_9BACI|nr:sulfurtransferase TusA family protein [Alkalibacillus filiformis]MDQ0351563.1 TusA-related sulfurtransferase [Alkalibacillus filiformis]MDQ0352614.1 TusA-related sulfurtransferase [Alkalibacillus filiformis]